MWLKHIKFGRGIKPKWKRIDNEKTEEYMEKLMDPEIDTDDEEECKESEDKSEEIETIDLSDSQSHSLEAEIEAFHGDYTEYVQNKEELTNPHHANSLMYARSRTSEPDKTLECYWVFPAQHEHRQNINNIESKDYAKVTIEDEYLNDTIIDFQLKYTYASWPAAFKQNVYIFTSFFWKKLIKIKHQKETTKQTVKQLLRWTKHIQHLFDKKYLIIPKCECMHWELIIICNAGQVLKKYLTADDEDENEDMEETEEKETPCIAVLDSMNSNRKGSEIRLIRKWLNLEAENRNKCENVNSKEDESNDDDLVAFDEIFTAKTITGYCVKVPRQPNSHDCGCFLLRNVLQFGIDRGFEDTSSKKIFNLIKWYEPSDGVAYRKEISTTLARLIAEQAAVTHKLREKWKLEKKELIRQKIKLRKEKAANANNFKGYEEDSL